jgi:membrane protein implicated in regulation of membrane protease activity
MTAVIALLIENWQIIASAIAGAALYLTGRKQANRKHERKELKADEKANKRINAIEPVDPDDSSDIVDRLRRHGQ